LPPSKSDVAWGIAPGQGYFTNTVEYVCNPVHALFPIVVTVNIPVIVQ